MASVIVRLPELGHLEENFPTTTLIENKQELQWLLARAKNVCDVFILLRIKVEGK